MTPAPGQQNFYPIRFSDSVTLKVLETQIARVEEHTDPVHLDFSDASFIEPGGLIYLLATFLRWRVANRDFAIALPHDKRVRDFLRVWQFPEALGEIGLSFWRIVTAKDRKYFGENKAERDNYYAGETVADGIERLVSERFFSLLPLHPRTAPSKADLVIQETARWRKELVKTVLENHLDGPADYIPSRVIYESITNALRHPDATLIFTTSRYDTEGQWLTITVWDNGESIIDTLRRPLTEGKPIRARSRSGALAAIKLKRQSADGTHFRDLNDAYTPDLTAEDYEFLVASVLPGVTSDPEGERSIRVSEDASPGPGMGLFILINAAIDVFGGSVGIRTKRHFMNIKSAGTLQRYRFKVEDATLFFGNMITVRLPLRTASEAPPTTSGEAIA